MYQQPKLKEVSKAKHRILERYFPAWAKILGSQYSTLVYVDCFAGAGSYAGGEPGSPLVILNKATELVQTSTTRFAIVCIFVEKDADAASILQSEIPQNLPDRVNAIVLNEDAHDFVPKLLQLLPDGIPTFFFIDPYGHPITIPIMNQILQRPRTEILLNMMWWVLNIHLGNKRLWPRIDSMFGNHDWRHQPFMRLSRQQRELTFVDYFVSKLKADYALRFRIRFSPEDEVRGRNRTKYYLIHLSNHRKAVLVMKEVMWPIGDEEGTFDYSATGQGMLISRTPKVEELIGLLKETYCGSGKKLTFDQLREETWRLPFIEKHYREAIKELERANLVQVQRRDSKKDGIKGRDLLIF